MFRRLSIVPVFVTPLPPDWIVSVPPATFASMTPELLTPMTLPPTFPVPWIVLLLMSVLPARPVMEVPFPSVKVPVPCKVAVDAPTDTLLRLPLKDMAPVLLTVPLIVSPEPPLTCSDPEVATMFAVPSSVPLTDWTEPVPVEVTVPPATVPPLKRTVEPVKA